MKLFLFYGLFLGLCLTAAPCLAQSAQTAADKPPPSQTAPPTPEIPPAAQKVDPEELSHQAMVEEQERRDREEQAERDRDDQARQSPPRPLPDAPLSYRV